MINTLEEKVFKKFSFIDDRSKKESEDIMKLLNSDELKNMKLEKLEKNLNDCRSCWYSKLFLKYFYLEIKTALKIEKSWTF